MAYNPQNANGQATMANSAPVVLASNQSTVSVKETMTVGTANLSSLNAVALVTIGACETNVNFEITGTWTGTIIFEISTDNSTFYTVKATNVVSEAIVSSVVNNAQNGLYKLNLADGVQYVRARMSAYTSGTASVTQSVFTKSSSTFVRHNGTFTTQESGAALTSLQLLDDTVATDGSAVLTKGLQIAGTDGTNAQIMSVTSAGRVVTEEAGAALTALQLLDNCIISDNAGFTDGTTALSIAGFIFDEAAGTSLTENDAAAARVDSKRAQVLVIEDGSTRGQRAGVTSDGGLETVCIPHTSGGLTTYHLSSAATTNSTVVKASAGQLYGWYIYNNNSSMRKIAFHNSSTGPTAGAGIFMTLCIPGSSGANVMSDIGIVFSSGISITTVTGAADTNATAVGADDLNINLYYK